MILTSRLGDPRAFGGSRCSLSDGCGQYVSIGGDVGLEHLYFFSFQYLDELGHIHLAILTVKIEQDIDDLFSSWEWM